MFQVSLAWGQPSARAYAEDAPGSRERPGALQPRSVFFDLQLTSYDFPNGAYSDVSTVGARVGVVTMDHWRASLFGGYAGSAVPSDLRPVNEWRAPDPQAVFGASFGRVVHRSAAIAVAPSLAVARTEADLGTNLLLLLPFESTSRIGTRIGFDLGAGLNLLSANYLCDVGTPCRREGYRVPELTLLGAVSIGGDLSLTEPAETHGDDARRDAPAPVPAAVSDHSLSAPLRFALQFHMGILHAEKRWSAAAGGVHFTLVLPLGFRAGLGVDKLRSEANLNMVNQDIDYAFSSAFGFDLAPDPALTVAPSLALTVTTNADDGYLATIRVPVTHTSDESIVLGAEFEGGVAIGGRYSSVVQRVEQTRATDAAVGLRLVAGYQW